MKLRALVLALAVSLLAAPLSADAQQAGKVYRVGSLGTSSPSLELHLVEAFRQGLPALAAELVRLNPDVIVTTGTPGTLAAKQATKTIPIVMASDEVIE